MLLTYTFIDMAGGTIQYMKMSVKQMNRPTSNKNTECAVVLVMSCVGTRYKREYCVNWDPASNNVRVA